MRREEIALRIAAVRADIELSQRAMAEKIGVAYRTWQGIENGNNVPSGETLLKIVDLGYSPGWILTGEGEMKAGVTAPAGLRTVDPAIFKKIAARIEDVYRELKINPTKAEISEWTAELYNEILAAETDLNDPDELDPAISVQIARLKRGLAKGANNPKSAVA